MNVDDPSQVVGCQPRGIRQLLLQLCCLLLLGLVEWYSSSVIALGLSSSLLWIPLQGLLNMECHAFLWIPLAGAGC
jgi:hypothetical protein